jgi:hypothetical protein
VKTAFVEEISTEMQLIDQGVASQERSASTRVGRVFMQRYEKKQRKLT